MFWVRADHPRRTREHRLSKSLLCPSKKIYVTTLESLAEPERVFSRLNHLLSNPKRANLKDKTIRLTTVRQDIACCKIASFDRKPPKEKAKIEDQASTEEEEAEASAEAED